jgi:hypothetical protein
MASECEFEGVWHDGRAAGQGRMRCSDGRVYQGTFSNNLCHGLALFEGPVVRS